MNNSQAALIAAAQVVGGLAASGYYKQDQKKGYMNLVGEMAAEFEKLLPKEEPVKEDDDD